MIGKKIRLAQLFQHNSTFIVPMDHSVTNGPIQGLKDYITTIRNIKEAGTDAIILHKGLLKRIAENTDLASFSYIMHLSASIGWDKGCLNKVLVSDVEEAVKMGAIGVSMQVNLNNEYSSKMLSDLGQVSRMCDEWGMPLIVMMYVQFGLDKIDYSRIIHAARIAEELGADVVKIPFLGYKNLESLVDVTTIPVLISGGQKMEKFQDLLSQIDHCMRIGISGVAIGRNVFQRENILESATKISNLIHKRSL